MSRKKRRRRDEGEEGGAHHHHLDVDVDLDHDGPKDEHRIQHSRDGQQDKDEDRPTFRPIHGNFRNYYAIRGRSGGGKAASTTAPTSTWTAASSGVCTHTPSPKHDIDPRLRNLLKWAVPASPSMPFHRILDIGCNSGELTIDLAHALQAIYATPPAHVLGVDIDPELIDDAHSALKSLQGQGQPAHKRRRRMERLALPIPPQQQSIALFQPRPVKVKQASASTSKPGDVSAQPNGESKHQDQGLPPVPLQAFPSYVDNVHFTTTDWVNDKPPISSRHAAKDGAGWDLIMALSLTKWVHINSGTRGILKLFARAASELREPSPSTQDGPERTNTDRPSQRGGVLLLEPQAWSSYQTARSQGADVRARIKALQSPVPLEPDNVQEGGPNGGVGQPPRKKRRRRRRKGGEAGPPGQAAEGEGTEHGEGEDIAPQEATLTSPPTPDDVPPPGPTSTPTPTAETDASTYAYPPIHPDDFPYLLTALFGLEGPHEIGHSTGAGFARALQVYTQPALDPATEEVVRETRDKARKGRLVLFWVPRAFR